MPLQPLLQQQHHHLLHHHHHHHQDQDFYCSFTHLPQSSINADELPYTLHSKHTIARLRNPYPMHLHRRMPSLTAGGPRPDSFGSTASKRSIASFFSTSTASTQRRRKLLAKVKQLFGGRAATRRSRDVVLRVARKPSTLDFRCVGMDSRLELACSEARREDQSSGGSGSSSSAQWGRPPRIDIVLPGETEWGRFFDGLF